MPQQGAAPLAPLTRLSLHTHKNSIPAFGVCTIFAGFHFIREVIPIAIYHCNISIVSRGKGKSAVAAAAYRSGEKLTNEWDGMTHDYTRKGGVVHTEIMLPPHAPPSFSDRSTLWNSVELYEKAGNAQLAREIDAALPIELSREEQIRLVREYCSSQFVSRGMCVDYAIHDTGKGNPHCHIMLTMRPLDERGAWAAKSQKEYDLDENGERIKSIGQTVQRDNYELVYTAPLLPSDLKGDTTEQLFYRFNNEHPADYRHPSMSVSDIVAIKRDGKVSCHYCDSFGFEQVPGFLPDNPLKNAEMAVEDDYGMIDGIINNGPKEPTVAQLEQQARSGQPISLMDLAAAAYREDREKKKSVMEQLKSQPKAEHKKTAPKKSAEREI